MASSWADAHDGETLREIAAHRDALLTRASTHPEEPEHALALARLVDVEGSRDDVRDVILRARERCMVPHDLTRIHLAAAKHAFDRGRVDDAEECARAALGLAEADESLGEQAAHAHLVLTRIQQLRGAHERASEHLAAASALVLRHGEASPWLVAIQRALVGTSRLAQGRRLDARAAFEEGLRAALGHDGDVEAAMLAGFLGNLEHDEGRLDDAVRFYRVAIRHARAVGNASVRAVFIGYRAWALHELGDEAGARRHYRDAISSARSLGLARFEAQFRALAAVAGLTRDNRAARVIELSQALSDLQKTGDAQRFDAMRTLSAVVEARLSHDEDDSRRRVAHLMRASRCVDEASVASDDGRIALRMARAHIDDAVRAAVGRHPAQEPRRDRLRVTLSASRFGLGTVSMFDLSRFETQQRLLRRLLVGWADERTVPDAELIEAAWPNERLVPSAATHRLQVAISSLRRAGLNAMLTRGEGGYHLAVDEIDLVAEDSTEPTEPTDSN